MDAFYNDLDLSLVEAQTLIAEGANNRRSSAHCPTIATLDNDGRPTQRIMILRHVDWHSRRLRFHTDARTNKVPARRDASVLFYDPERKVQLRLAGSASIVRDGPEFEEAWVSSSLFARRCYLAGAAPGALSNSPVSGLPDFIEGRQPNEDEIVHARENFALLFVEFGSVEWLYLANAGHRRARWHWDGQDWQGSWLIP